MENEVQKTTKVIEEEGKKYEVTFQETSRVELTKENLAETALRSVLVNASDSVIEDVLVELKNQNII